MQSDTGEGPLRGVDDVDWPRHAGEGGAAIPGLLRELHTGEDPLEASLALGELLNYPAPGHAAAPGVVAFLVRIGCAPETPRPYDTLTLLHEFAAGHPGDNVPKRRDVKLWRDEIAWTASADTAAVREKYQDWVAEAPDEQQRRRFTTQLRALERGGAPLIAAELATYDAIRERIPRLMRLIHDPVLRGREFVPQELANLFALFPEQAEKLIPLLRAYERLSDIPEEDLPSALYAMGMLCDASDEKTVSELAGKVFDSDDAMSFTAALTQVQLLGEKAPDQALEAFLPQLAAPGLDELFPSPYADIDDHTFAMLTAGLLGERARAAKSDSYGVLFAVWDSGRDAGLLVADALELALGPRSQAQSEAHIADLDTHAQQALRAIAALSAQTWERSGVPELLTAWGLPGVRSDFALSVGAEDALE